MTETFAIECPLQPDKAPSVIRADGGAIEVSLTYADGPDVQSLLPRFLGDRCHFVAPANSSGQEVTDVEFWTTECPLNESTSESACFLRANPPER